MLPLLVFVEQGVETPQAGHSFPLRPLSRFWRLSACDAWLGACRDHGRAEELNSSSKSREAMLKDNSAVCRFYARGKRKKGDTCPIMHAQVISTQDQCTVTNSHKRKRGKRSGRSLSDLLVGRLIDGVKDDQIRAQLPCGMTFSAS